jgi:hypothetical protein
MISIGEMRRHPFFTADSGVIAIIAKDNTTPTDVLYKIVKNCSNYTSRKLIFSNAILNNPAYNSIKKYIKRRTLSKNKISKSINESTLSELADLLDAESKESEESRIKRWTKEFITMKHECHVCYDSDTEEDYNPKRNEPWPDYLIILDDITNINKDAIYRFILAQKKKTSLRIKLVMICREPEILDQELMKLPDFWFLFSGLSDDEISHIHNNKSPYELQEKEFLEVYNQATKSNEFLYIDKCSYRSGFCDIIKMNSPKETDEPIYI